jgi:hypothetical protein
MALGSQVGSQNGSMRGSMALKSVNRAVKKAQQNPARRAFLLVNNALPIQNKLVRRGHKAIPVRRHSRPHLSADIAH